jgi:hypothetical protein
MSSSKDHHYIPKYYLKGFTIPGTIDKIWLYQKASQEAISTSLKNVGVEKHFYSYTTDEGIRDSDSLERYLNEEVEQPANKVIKKLRQQHKISSSEKIILARYMAVMLKRVPKNRERLHVMAPKIFGEVQSEYTQQLDAALQKNPEKSELVERRKAQLDDILSHYADEIPDFLFGDVLRKDIQLTKVISQMKWLFYVTKSDQTYITSDNPVFYFESWGIANKNNLSEITFPISSSICLHASWRNDPPEGIYIAPEKFVKEFNRRSVDGAMKYIYAPFQEDWLIRLVNKRKIYLSRIE